MNRVFSVVSESSIAQGLVFDIAAEKHAYHAICSVGLG